MANWERKQANTLADAIDRHRRNHPHLVRENELLARIQVVVDRASKTVATSAQELGRCRASVCDICRNAALYDCDVPNGWSANCALIAQNAIEPLETLLNRVQRVG